MNIQYLNSQRSKAPKDQNDFVYYDFHKPVNGDYKLAQREHRQAQRNMDNLKRGWNDLSALR